MEKRSRQAPLFFLNTCVYPVCLRFMAPCYYLAMVTESEQHGEGIDFGDSPEIIRERGEMWSNVRRDLSREIELKFAEDLFGLDGKKLRSEINSRVTQEVKRRLSNGKFKGLREKVMYESWDLLETAQDVERMTPLAVEKMLEQFIGRAEENQPPAETAEESAAREKEEEEKKRAEMKESFRETQEREAGREEVHSLADEMEKKKKSLEMAKWMQMMLDKGQAVENEPDKRIEQFEQWKKERGEEPEQKVA